MRANMEAGCRMTEILMTGYGITNYTSAGVDLLILTGRMWDSFIIDSEMRDEKQKITGLRT